MHSFIHLRLPKIDPAKRSLAANTAFFELASNIVSANIFAKRSLDQHTKDVSDKMREFREEMRGCALKPDRAVRMNERAKWIDQCFSRTYTL
mgnify:CR=1 FL=1